MISSAAPGEGKTTIALSLVRALVDSGRTALLVDGDLRQPSLHVHVGLQPSAGLSEYLLNVAESPAITEIVVRDPASGASLILGARRKNLPTGNRFGGEAMRRLLAVARQNFDVVILDTPPIGPVIDGVYLAESADIIVFVLTPAGTTQADARIALAALAEVKSEPAEILVAINQDHQARPRRHASYRRYYEDA